MRLFLVMLAGLGLIAGLQDSEAGAGEKALNPVKVTASASGPDADGKQLVTVTMETTKPWHTYANPVGNDDFANNATKVSFKAGGKVEDVKIEYPAGQLDENKFRVYEGTVQIKATLRRAKGDTGPLEITVSYSACNSKTKKCLPEKTVELKVP